MSDYQNDIDKRLRKYKQKYFVDQLIKGLILSGLIATILVFSLSSVETLFRLGSIGRAVLFFTYVVFGLFLLVRYILYPLAQLLRLEKSLSDQDAANSIGRFFPSIGDRLINYLQLREKEFEDNALAKASMMRRAENLSNFRFSDAIDKTPNKKRLRILLPALGVFIVILLLSPQFFVSSTTRIVNYEKEFLPEAPFEFLVTEELNVFRNEDFLFEINLVGESIPSEVFIINEERRLRAVPKENGTFEYLFRNIQQSKVIRVEAAGFLSPVYAIRVVDRPALNSFSIDLAFPTYLRRRPEKLENVGSFEIPEGTKVGWNFNSVYTEQLSMLFANDSVVLQAADNGLFEYQRRIRNNQTYEVVLENKNGHQQGIIEYDIQVIKDVSPEINVNVLMDTILYNYVMLAGNISDDYGIKKLVLNYTKNDSQPNSMIIPVGKDASSQSFVHEWDLHSLALKEGEVIEFYLEVFDNDGVNGSKSTRTSSYKLAYPTKEESAEQVAQATEKTQKDMESAAQEAKELKETIDELAEKLKSKKELTWQDEKLLEELLEKRESINEEIEKLQEENKNLQEQQKKFQENSEQIQQKQEQLQELLNELLDDETMQMYEELKKLLENYEKPEEVQDMLEQIQKKEINLEQELERTLELFKRLQFEQKLEQDIAELDSLAKEQEQLSEETKDRQNDLDSLLQKQNELNKKFEDQMKEMDETRELNQDLKRPNSFEDTSGEENEIQEEQKSASDNLENNKRNKSSQSQKSAAEKMKKMSEKMKQMQGALQSQQMQANLGDLEAILNNLITLSFDQESVMKEFREVKQSDPRFISLSQEQLKLKDDAKIVEDSLLALAQRVPDLSSFVTRELNEMKSHMDESVTAIRDRQKPTASAKQQLAMTSMNNLALLLDNTMKQMQEMMAQAMGNPNPNGEGETPSLSELQKKLSEQIQELKQSGKSGKELSEELAKLAAEQEEIRKALEEADEKYGDKPGGMNDILQKMEENEIDLVNKRITQETIKRQQEIITRMLEAEQAMREKEQDTERESKTAVQYEKELPKAFEEYLKQREKEIELLKTVPIKLLPYYKNEVNLYFERLKQNQIILNN